MKFFTMSVCHRDKLFVEISDFYQPQARPGRRPSQAWGPISPPLPSTHLPRIQPACWPATRHPGIRTSSPGLPVYHDLGRVLLILSGS